MAIGMRFGWTWFVVGAVAASSVATPAVAQRPDVVRGRIVAADSSPLPNAAVTAIDTVAKTPPRVTRTDSTGRFLITFENGSGTYMVAVAMLGQAPQRRLVTRGADGSMPAADFKMSPIAAQLGAVRTVGERPKAPRSDLSGDFSVGGTTTFQNLSSGLSGDVTGDLSAILATLPAISVTPNGDGTLSISAFGISGDQNGLVLNGMNFGAPVPRDGFRLQVVSASYDASKGGFAGIQQSLRMNAGNNTISRSTHITFDAPGLQWTSPVASNLGTRYGQLVASGSVGGPIVVDKAFYATAYQFSRRASGLTSLQSADSSALAALHLSPDSVSQFLKALMPTGIPSRTSRVPANRENMSGSLAFRFDFAPNVPPSQPGQFFQNNATFDDYYLEMGATMRKSGASNIGPTSIPSSGSETNHKDGWLQFTAAKYLPRNTLNETTVSLAGSDDANDPYLGLPSANVLVASQIADGGVGISSLRAGGSGGGHGDSKTWTTELKNQTTYNTWDRHHSVSLTLDGTLDGYAIQQDAGYGTFFFNSLADFATGTPASFSRTLTALRTTGSGFNGAVGLGDTYNPNTPLSGPLPPGTTPSAKPTIQYGLRLEGNHLGVRPAYSPEIDSLFGARTDHVPGGVRVMPMVGFNWPVFGQYKVKGLAFGWRGQLSGGVREYRGPLATRSIDAYTRQTGLPSAIQQLYCVGPAAPLPDWHAFEQGESFVPTTCANGGASTPLAQTAPPVSSYARDYAMSDSWRPALSLSYTMNASFRVAVNGTWAINRDLPSTYDLNFNPMARFSLASEGGRPIYVSSTSIVPSTGAESWTESRVSPDFAHVSESRSDLRSEVRTIGTTLFYSPFVFFGGPSAAFLNGSIGYTYNDAREQYRGFQSTAGDPREVAWSPSNAAKHVVTVNVSRFQQNLVNVSLQARFQSGARYTPSVSGDINGDGYANDRAFVFNPSAPTTDATTAAAMTQLLGSTSGAARRCLERQLGAVAGRNSCVGPWSMTQLNMSIQPDAYRFGFRNRGSFSLLLTNLGAGLDQALHGSSMLHGWGQSAFPDPRLLTVRGFDPTTNRFTYTVNPLFGNTAQFRNTFRSPFMVTLDVRLEVGPDRETQFLESLLRPRASEGPVLTLEQIKNRIARGFNPFDQLLQQKDTIRLTPAQVDSVAKISKGYSVRRDSIATDMARYLLARHGDYGGEEVRERWHSAGVASYAGYIRGMRAVVAMWTLEQRAVAQTKPQFLGYLNIANFKDSDIATILRGAMSSLP